MKYLLTSTFFVLAVICMLADSAAIQLLGLVLLSVAAILLHSEPEE
jgi:hypothetical protein